MDTTSNTDSALWCLARVGNGPVYVALTQEGSERAFSVGAQVNRKEGAARALMFLSALGGTAELSTRIGSRMTATDFGRSLSGSCLAYLGEYGIGFISRDGERVALTDAGRAEVADGHAEQGRLLARCERASKEVA